MYLTLAGRALAPVLSSAIRTMSKMRARGRNVAGVSLALLLFFTRYSFADEIQGRVVSVADGDTLTVLDASHTQHRVRLNGIDAPETRQAYSQVSKRPCRHWSSARMSSLLGRRPISTAGLSVQSVSV